MVYTESFQDVASAMGLASIGRSVASFSLAPIIGNLRQNYIIVNVIFRSNQ